MKRGRSRGSQEAVAHGRHERSSARRSFVPAPRLRWALGAGLSWALRRWTRGVVANFGQNFARFRLYRRRSFQVNTRFAAFFKTYQITKLKFLKLFGKFCNVCKMFAEFSQKLLTFSNRCFANILRLQRCKNMQIL